MAKSKTKKKIVRTPVPADVEKIVMAEAGARCSMPGCESTADLVIHHIDGNPSKHEPANLLVMCSACHALTNTGEIDRKSCKAVKRDLALRSSSADDLERMKEDVTNEIFALVGNQDDPTQLDVDDKGSRMLDLRLESAANQALTFDKAKCSLPEGIVRALVTELHKAGASESALAVQETIMIGEDISPVEHFNLGILLDQAGRGDEAKSAFHAAMDSVAGNAEALSSLAGYLHDAERPEAEDAYRMAVEADPKDAQYHNSLAYYLWECDRAEESEAEVRKALEIDANDAYANATLGLLLLDKDDLEGGRKGYELAVKMNPDDLPLLQRYHFEYGRALGRNGRMEDARQELLAAYKVDSKYIPKERIESELANLAD